MKLMRILKKLKPREILIENKFEKTLTEKIKVDDLDESQKKGAVSLKNSNSGNNITSKVMGFFSLNNHKEEENKEIKHEQTPQFSEKTRTWNVNMSKDDKLYGVSNDSREKLVKMLKYHR